MNKRIQKKQLKQFCRKNYDKKCWCGRTTELKERLIIIDEYLGKIVVNIPYSKCPIHYDVNMEQVGKDLIIDQMIKTRKRLLLEKRPPRKYEYYSLKQTSELVNLSEHKLLKLEKKYYPRIDCMKYKGEWVFLKESVDKYIRTKGRNGSIKLVDYRTEADDWIKRVLLHENYDIDVEFFDGTCRRTHGWEYLQSLEEDDELRIAVLDNEQFRTPLFIDSWGIYYCTEDISYEDAVFDNVMLYKGEIIPNFEGGQERDEGYGGGQTYIFE